VTYAAMTKGEVQRSIRTFNEVVKIAAKTAQIGGGLYEKRGAAATLDLFTV